ncbi:MAG: hypothetical protein NC938_06275 [Candidatus Omnitrophica bacterium]|nr:hypothetical protein [Candidatus Omnitrophota bacterium]MCM8791284.1 hypothetical protein [Candidatus Omnitrophota bacterium]
MGHKKVMTIFSIIITVFLSDVDLQAKENFKVCVSVAGAENTAGQVKSYVERYLRALGDVTIVDDSSAAGKDYDILISCISDEKDSRRVYLGVIFAKSLGTVYEEIADEIRNPASREFITDFLAKISIVPVSFPQPFVGTERDLETMSKDIVTAFDDMVLASHRRMWEKYGSDLDPRNFLAGLWETWNE